MLDPSLIDQIIQKYLHNEDLSDKERSLLEEWIHEGHGTPDLLEYLRSYPEQTPDTHILEASREATLKKLLDKLAADGIWVRAESVPAGADPAHISRATSRIWRLAAVGTLVLAIMGLAVFWHTITAHQTDQVREAARPDLLPAANRATLVLADGRSVNLDSAATGKVASQGQTSVVKTTSKGVVYTHSSAGTSALPAYNTLITPRAGQFSVSLPDGTTVWLNNASSLRFPVQFPDSAREVVLSGEAYFEVAHHPEQPFRVLIADTNQHRRGSAVEALGTSFNIMAYMDETVQKTTLIAGAVRFSGSGADFTLSPGDQAAVSNGGRISRVKGANIEDVISWRKGYFHFDHASLQEAMRQIARWYDVSVEYQGKIPPQEFSGKIQREFPLQVLLQGMEGEHVHLMLTGRTVVVSP